MTGHVYAVASGKGGVGKTTTVVNLGVTLRADDRSVALVDADLGMANLGAFLGIDHEPTLHDVLADRATVDEAVVEVADHFGVLPGARDLKRYAAAEPTGLQSIVAQLAERYEYVLVDTGAGVGFEDVLPLELVDTVVLVATPDSAALGDAEKTAEIAALLDVSVRGLVLTRADDPGEGAGIADDMGLDLLAVIPDDPRVPESTAAGQPLEAFAPDSEATRGYRELAATLTGRDVERFAQTSVSADRSSSRDAAATTEEPSTPTDAPRVDADGDAGASQEGDETSAPTDDTRTSTDASREQPDDSADESSPDDPPARDGPGRTESGPTTDDGGETAEIGENATGGDGAAAGTAAEAADGDGDATGEAAESADADGDDPNTGVEATDRTTENARAEATASTPTDAEADAASSDEEADADETTEDGNQKGGILARLGGLFG